MVAEVRPSPFVYGKRPSSVPAAVGRKQKVVDEKPPVPPLKEASDAEKLKRAVSEANMASRPNTAPGQRRRSVNLSSKDNSLEAFFKLSHLRRTPSFSIPSCPKRSSLSGHRNSWYPMVRSEQVKPGNVPSPADADLSRISHYGRYVSKGHRIGTAPRFRDDSNGKSRIVKPLRPTNDRPYQFREVLGQKHHPRLRTSPSYTMSSAPRFFHHSVRVTK